MSLKNRTETESDCRNLTNLDIQNCKFQTKLIFSSSISLETEKAKTKKLSLPEARSQRQRQTCQLDQLSYSIGQAKWKSSFQTDSKYLCGDCGHKT